VAGEPRSGDLVEVAFVRNEGEAAMVRGLLETAGIPSFLQGVGIDGPRVGVTWLPNSQQRVLVHAERADQARALVERTLAENEAEAWSNANAEYLDEAIGGRKPRSYGLIGGVARIYLWGFGVMAVAFGVFLLVRAL
jgi:hypothetical protein